MKVERLPSDALLLSLLPQIGRGAMGSRPVSRAEARELFLALFEHRLSPVAIGALVMAMRMKGETVDEVLGALDALNSHVRAIPTVSDIPVVSIPSYNGARSLPNLTWLLACLVAREGIQTIVHGVKHDPKRVITMNVVRACGHLPMCNTHDAMEHFALQEPVFVMVDTLSPVLAELLDLRWQLGVRNIGHTLAKLLNPTSRAHCLRISAYTHPEFNALQHELFSISKAPAVLTRATEGEVVANVRRASSIDFMHRGHPISVVAADAPSRMDQRLPELPPKDDLEATARYTLDVLADKLPVPRAIALQVEAIVNAARLSCNDRPQSNLANPDTPTPQETCP